MIVLIADDVADNRDLLSRLVQIHGHEPIVAADGLEAVEKTRLQAPDLIFMDISMPIMSGYEAISLIRKDSRYANTPIIAFTAHAMREDQEACRAAGCDEVVTKPLDISRVQEILLQYAVAVDFEMDLEVKDG